MIPARAESKGTQVPSDSPARSQLPRISVVVPHYDQLVQLDGCLRSLEDQTLPREAFEIVVVDNASPIGEDAVRGVVRDRAIFAVEREKGAGPARNRGVVLTTGAVIAFLDADCVAHPQWLEEGLKGLESFDLTGGRVDVSVADEDRMTGPEAFERVFAFDTLAYIRDKNFTISGNLFTTRKVFERVGGFRNGVSEDMEWCQRAVAMGYTLGYHEAASISHPARATWPELVRKWARMNRETRMLADDTPFGTLRWMARSYLLPASILPHAVRVLRSPALPDRRARARGLVTLARIRMWRFFDAHRLLLGGKPPR